MARKNRVILLRAIEISIVFLRKYNTVDRYLNNAVLEHQINCQPIQRV